MKAAKETCNKQISNMLIYMLISQAKLQILASGKAWKRLFEFDWIECIKAAWNSSTVLVGFSKIWPTSKIGRCFLEILLFSFNYSEIGLWLTCELLGKNTKEIENNWKDFPALCSQKINKRKEQWEIWCNFKVIFWV